MSRRQPPRALRGLITFVKRTSNEHLAETFPDIDRAPGVIRTLLLTPAEQERARELSNSRAQAGQDKT